MTDKELYYKLEPDGCWHEWTLFEGGGELLQCKNCKSNITHSSLVKHGKSLNPDFTTPEGFFWLWERCIEKDWWEEFLGGADIPDLPEPKTNFASMKEAVSEIRMGIYCLLRHFIHPTRFRDALKEYLKENEG